MAARLFKPFRLGVWLRLLLIAWLSGYLGQAGCNNSNFNVPGSGSERRHKREQAAAEHDKKPAKPYTCQDLRKDIGEFTDGAVRYSAFIVLGAGLVGAVLVFFAWISARFQFVFIDVLVSGVVAVIEPFKRHRETARTLFFWNLAMSAVGVVLLIGFFWMVAASLLQLIGRSPELALEKFFAEHLLEVISIIAGYVVLLIIVCILLGIVGMWTMDFVVPIMFQKRCSVLAAWSHWLALVRQSFWEAAKYILWRWLMAIVISVVLGLAYLAILLALVLVGVVVGLIGAGLASALPALKWPLAAAGILLLVLVFLAIFFGAMMAMTPPAVWIRYLSLRYLQSLNAGYHFFSDTPPLPGASGRA